MVIHQAGKRKEGGELDREREREGERAAGVARDSSNSTGSTRDM